MLQHLQQVTLKSGETSEIIKITAPQPDWEEPVRSRLAHKNDLWHRPMSVALREGLPGLTMNFFLLRIGDTIAGNLTVVQALERPIAILQHVFTDPEHRRKGICGHLMQALQDDFISEGGQAIYLGTDYDTPPFWIYHSCGFRPIGTTGTMVWPADESYPDSFFTLSEVVVRPSQWGDWPLVHALYEVENGWDLRGYVYSHFGHSSYESTFCRLQEAIEAEKAQQPTVLQSEATGAVVGHAFLARDVKWPGGPWVLDFFVHPLFADRSGTLLSAVQLPADAKVQAYCDAEASDRAELLQSCGFTREASLERQYVTKQGDLYDVHVYSWME